MQISKKTIVCKMILFFVIFLLLQAVLTFVAVPAKSITRVMLHDLYAQKDLSVVFVGASRIYRGIDPNQLDELIGTSSFDLSSGNQGMVDSYYLLAEMYKQSSPDLIVLDVNWRRFEPKSTVGALLPYINMKKSENKLSYLLNGFVPDDYLKAVFPGLNYPEKLLSTDIIKNPMKKLSSDYRNYIYDYPDTGYYAGKGFSRNTNSMLNGNMGQVTVPKWDSALIDEESILYFEKIVSLCRKNNSRIICIVPPVPLPVLMEMKDYSSCDGYIRNLVESQGLEYYNFNLLRPEVYTAKEEYYFDEVHMSGKGAFAFTGIMASFISEYRSGSLDIGKYLLQSYEELVASSPRILNTWLELDASGERFLARANTGSGLTPEYEFLYKSEQDGEYAVLYSYAQRTDFPVAGLAPGKYTIRVNTRPQGSAAAYEQYDETAYTKK